MNSSIPDEEAVFKAARRITDLPARRAYLSEVCGGDPALLGRMHALLRVEEEDGEFLAVPAVAAAVMTEAPTCDAPGSMIGPYKLREMIGEGGMGIVYVADQDAPVRRRVALKVIKPGMDSRQVLARFEAERQALALMEHPNITRILDSGTTEQGRPYFVMELVRGVPITDYCDQVRLTPRQRLELFVPVCRAVQHAHQKGIIHRDLKPTNILVTLYDGRPVPKVIDFGIAKAVGARLTEHTAYTGLAQVVGTPLYMSPEQAEMSGLDVDTRSDVYSLGVLLYELLTGTTPFDAESLRAAGFDGMRRLIRESEPPRPSQRVSTLAAAARSTVSDRRRVDDRQLGRQLRGELDWVVMKCLEKDRNRRYDSAGSLAAEVERYLADEPVEACPPSAWYRVRKFWRRNRRALLPAGVVAAALVTATAVSTWLAVEMNSARRLADERADNEKQAREEAAREAAVARAVSDFLQTDLLKLTDRQVQTEFGFVANPNLTVREALDRAAATIGQRFQDQPLVEAAVRATIGEAYIGVYEPGVAMNHLRRSLDLYQANLDPHALQVILALERLAGAYGSNWQHREAVALFEKASAVRTAKFGPNAPETLRGMQRLAQAYGDAGRYSDGIALCQKALAMCDIASGPGQPSREVVVEQLAGLYRMAGEWERCAMILEPLLERTKLTHGPNHPRPVSLMANLAVPYAHMGRIDEALAMQEAVLECTKSTHGPEDDAMIGCLIGLARTCWLAGNMDKADGLLREAVRIARKLEGFRGAVGTAGPLMHLTQNLLLQRRYGEAEPLAREALAVYERLRLDDWRRFNAMSLVGGALSGQQKYDEAEALLIRGYEGLREREQTIYRPQLGRLTEAGERLVRFYEATKQPEKARAVREGLARLP